MSEDYESMSIRELRGILVLRGMDTSHMLEKKELIDAARKLDKADYDEEALKIFDELNLDPSPRTRYCNLDALWRHPESGGRFYVGNIHAASTLRVLTDHDITAVVNCQERSSENFFENDPRFEYFRFSVAAIRATLSRKEEDFWALNAYQPAFDFIDSALEDGRCVLVHCLAGAHRAGSLGCAYLMYRADLNLDEAIKTAKMLRPIINPFGGLLETLHYLDTDLKRRRNDLAIANTSAEDEDGSDDSNDENKEDGGNEKPNHGT